MTVIVVLNSQKRGQSIKRPIVLLYKGYKSSVNYDGELFVSKGSYPNFIRPTCSYTVCPLNFLTGSCPTERTTASYSSCLCLDFTDLPIPHRIRIFRGRLPCLALLVFVF